jgi:TatD DNase family protein
MEVDLPLVIHNREATDDILAILEEEHVRADAPERMRGILHCYVDPPYVAERAWNLGFFVGVGGIMTFSNSEVDQYVREVPLDQIVIETDSPYLAPEPHRGDRNEPAYVRHVAEHLAEIKDVPVEKVEEVTTKNAQVIYELEA